MPLTEDDVGRQIHPIELITTITHAVKTSGADTSAVALAANTDRVYALFQNESNQVIYLMLGDTAVRSQGIRLGASGGHYEINATNLYRGVVNYIVEGASKKLLVTEGV